MNEFDDDDDTNNQLGKSAVPLPSPPCRVCGNPRIAAEAHTYGDRCEDCAVGMPIGKRTEFCHRMG